MEPATVLGALLVTVALYAVFLLALVAAGRGPLARELARLIPNMAALFAALLRDPTVPRRAKIALGVGAAYLAMPLDLVPDVIPVVGALDDAIVVAFILRFVIRAAGRDAVTRHWRGEPATLDRILALAGNRSVP